MSKSEFCLSSISGDLSQPKEPNASEQLRQECAPTNEQNHKFEMVLKNASRSLWDDWVGEPHRRNENSTLLDGSKSANPLSSKSSIEEPLSSNRIIQTPYEATLNTDDGFRGFRHQFMESPEDSQDNDMSDDTSESNDENNEHEPSEIKSSQFQPPVTCSTQYIQSTNNVAASGSLTFEDGSPEFEIAYNYYFKQCLERQPYFCRHTVLRLSMDRFRLKTVESRHELYKRAMKRR